MDVFHPLGWEWKNLPDSYGLKTSPVFPLQLHSAANPDRHWLVSPKTSPVILYDCHPSIVFSSSISASRVCSDDEFPKVPIVVGDQRMPCGIIVFHEVGRRSSVMFSIPSRRVIWGYHLLAGRTDCNPCTLALDHGQNQNRKRDTTRRTDCRSEMRWFAKITCRNSRILCYLKSKRSVLCLQLLLI